MALINDKGEALRLADGVALPQIQEQSVLFVTRLKEVAKMGDEITVAHVLYLQGLGFKPASKVNFSSLEEWANALFQGNKTFFSKFKTWVKAHLGLLVDIRDSKAVEGTTFAVLSIDPEADAASLQDGLEQALKDVLDKGMLMSAKPRKAPKDKGSAGRGGSKNSNVLEVSNSQAVSEKIGIAAVLQNAEDIETQRLAEVQDLIAAILEHAMSNTNRQQVRDILGSAVTKLNKGFNLSAAMAKVA